MSKRFIVSSGFYQVLGLLLAVLCSTSALLADQRVAAELDITPDTFYELSFDAAGLAAPADSRIQMSDAAGLVHYDGVLTGKDYQLTPQKASYKHLFLSSSHGVKLKLILNANNVRITNVALTPATPKGMIPNGDLSMPGFEGWPVRSSVERVTHQDKPAILIHTNGYALGEFFPITGGAGYRYGTGSITWPGVTLLAYDKNKRFIDTLSNNFRNKPPISTPAEAAYLRVMLSTSYEHIPTHANVNFLGATLEEVTPAPVATQKKINKETSFGEETFGEIILAPGSDGRDEMAARELQYWIQQITGTTLPVLAEPSSIARVRLHVGQALAGEFKVDLKALNSTDGYAVRKSGQNIYIFGSSSRGTLFGVYAFLEKNTDIIWPRPNEVMDVVFTPQKSIEFSQTDFRSVPAFQWRFVSNMYRGNRKYIFQRWMGRNGLNSPAALGTGFDYISWMYGATIGYNGSFIGWARPDEDTQDLYPLVDGIRDVSRWRQPCYTHPQLVPRMAANIREKFQTLTAAGIEADYLHVTLADNWTVCSCDRCMTPIDLPDGTRLSPKSAYATKDALFFSTRTFIVLNQLAEELSKDYPNLKIQTHAYIFTAEPPAVKIHPNVLPQYAAYPTQNVRYPIMAGKGNEIAFYDKDIWKRRMMQWDKLDIPLGYFGYYYVPGFSALADTAAVDYRDLLKAGGIQAHTEGFGDDDTELNGWDFDGVEKWVMARLMWDPSQDPAELRKQYIQRTYHEAAPAMTQFFKTINEAWHAPDDSVFFNCHVGEQKLYDELIVKQKIEEKLRDQLVQAQKSAKHPAAVQMVNRTLTQFDDLKIRFGQHTIPLVEESKNEWLEASSPHWEKAAEFKDFAQVDDWREFNKQPAPQQTMVRMMHDHENLYVMFTANDKDLSSLVTPSETGAGVFPQGDRVELMIRVNSKTVYYIAAGPNGTFYSMPEIKGKTVNAKSLSGDAWIAMVAIPLADIKWSKEQPAIEFQLGRVYRHDATQRVESTLNGASMFNKANVFWGKAVIQP